VQCQNNLKQIALAVHTYHDAYSALPAGTLSNPSLVPEERLSWLVALLPHLEQANLSRKLDPAAGWDAEENREAVSFPVKVFQCSARPGKEPEGGPGWTSYVGIAGVGAGAATLPADDRACGAFGYDRRVGLADIKDGIASTLLAVETTSANGPWAAGGPATVRGLDPALQPYVAANGPFGLVHRDPLLWQMTALPALANAAMADGSVHAINGTVSPGVFEALATIAGGEEVPAGGF
jgi:hypothetical protein